MTYDDVGQVAINDDLIICLGNMWMSKNIGNKLKRRYYTSSRMRDSARLLMNLREKTGNSEYSMKDFLVPEHFDDVVFSALLTASPSFDDMEDLSAPSTAIKLGYDIKRLTTAKMGFAIRNKDDEERKQCLDFLKLMEMEWSLKVTKNAHVLLEVRRFNKDKPLPDPRDIEELASFLKKEIGKVELVLSKKPEPNVFRRAVMVAETRLLVYNKRRAGEIEGISVKQYLGRTRGITAMDKAMRSDLTDLETKLLESQEVLETRGKVFDLSSQEQSWLVNHLGHSMDIHKIHYRQTSSSIERIDIAKMMLIQEFNLSGKYAGKKLSEIDLKEITVASDGKILLSVEGELNEGAPEADTELTAVIDDEGYTPGIYNRDELDVFLFNDDDDSTKQTKRLTGVTRVKWTTEEMNEILKYFKEDIDAEKTPGKKECKAAMEKSKRNKGMIHSRNWETIKKKVCYEIQKKK